MDVNSAISRRTFLRRTAAAGAALAVAQGVARGAVAAAPQVRVSGTAQRVIVIGAGLAGLSAAYELVAAGHDVTVLEARSRPGGRVLTLREPFADGLYAEAGAMQVFDLHERVFRYLREFNIEADPIQSPPLATIVHVAGRRIEVRPGVAPAWPFALKADEKSLTPSGLWTKYVGPTLAEIRAAEAAGTFPAPVARYDTISFTEFLRRQGASQPAIAILSVLLPSGLGDGSDHVSALNLLRESVHRLAVKQAHTIRGGSDRLPLAFATRLADRIRYGSPVVRLEQDASGVRVICAPGGLTQTLTGDRAVCAIPFTVLRRIPISPAISVPKRWAVEKLEYTSVTRVFVQTRRRFWLDGGYSGSASTDLPVRGVYVRTLNQPGTRGILESYTAGPQSRAMSALPESERVAAAIAGIRTVFPGAGDAFEGGVSKSWDEDEWTRGAYAWFRPGQMSALLPHIASPEGRLHFAGEHASSQPGWMEGALEAGSRVAQEIMSAGQAAVKPQ